MSGWADLGAALAGNNGLADVRGYQAGLTAANEKARIDNAMFEARKSRDAELGRQALAKQAFDKGDDELGNFFLQGTNPASIGSYQIDRQKVDFGNRAMDAATSATPDTNLVNRMLMVMSGKPADLTQIQGNTVINPTVTPDQQHLQTTDLGQAMIGAERALAGERGASARASDALAAKRSTDGNAGIDDATMQSLMAQAGEMANLGGPGANADAADEWLRTQVASHGGFGKAAPASKAGGGDLTKAEIDALFGDSTGGVDRAAYKDFLKYQFEQSQRDPRFENSRFAARAYAAKGMHNVEAGAATTAGPQAPVEESLGSSLMSKAGDLMGALTGGGKQNTAADAVGPLTPEQAQALPPGTLFKTTDGRILRRH